MHGNMKLIVELFKLDMVSGSIVKTCLDELFQELTSRNVEVLCSMLDTLTSHQVTYFKNSKDSGDKDAKSSGTQAAEQKASLQEKNNHNQHKKNQKQSEQKKQYKPKQSIVSLDYLENCLQSMFRERTNTQIESRVRFKI